jgi:hypothetical protein
MFYVVKKATGYIIWAGTPEQIFSASESDRSLSGRLDHHPFDTRAEAEQRIKVLTANQPENKWTCQGA